MKNLIQKKTFFLFTFFLLLLTACGPTEDSVNTSQDTSNQTPLEITYCNIDSSTLCLEGFGQEREDKMIVLLKAKNTAFNDIHIGIENNKNEILFGCTSVEDFETNIYCIGDFFPNGEKIELTIYSTDEVVAKGVFTIQYGLIQIPGNIEIDNPTYPPPSYPNYPNPSYPNYPNPSYKNATETP